MTAQLLRNRAIRLARTFFQAEQILEVRTNRIVSAPAMEPYIDAFAIHGHNGTRYGYLATSPEFALKTIFSAELKASPEARGICEITPVFRDDRPGKNHAVEFTMIEWYAKQAGLENILQQCVRLIAFLAKGLLVEDFRLETSEVHAGDELQRALKRPLPPGNFSFMALYRHLFDTIPQHLNALDGEIVCFNLLFDSLILPEIKKRPGLVIVSGYPDILAAMARVENGVAMRSELFYHGLELANAYSEEYDAETIRARWSAYNEIRRLREMPEHTPDERLLANLGAMRGASGIAVGLERLLMVLFPQLSAVDFAL